MGRFRPIICQLPLARLASHGIKTAAQHGFLEKPLALFAPQHPPLALLLMAGLATVEGAAMACG
jgi:hypothetical protein